MIRLVSLVFGILVFLSAPALLGRRRNTSPRSQLSLGFLALLGMFSTITALLAIVLDPEVLTVSSIPQLWHRCARAFMRIGGDPLGRWPPLLAGLGLALVVGRLVWTLVVGSVRTWTGRVLASDARWTMPSGARVYVVGVDHPEAYSIGRPVRQIIISRGLLDLLDTEERAAVLLHEEGHFKGGHHTVLLLSRAISASLAPLPQARAALRVIEQATEEAADDYAAERLANPAIVASGISKVALAHLAMAAETVSLGGGDVPGRVQRLLATDATTPQGVASHRLAFLLLSGLLIEAESVIGLAVLAIGHHMFAMGSAVICQLGM